MWTAIVLASLAALFLFLLFVPVDLRVRAATGGKQRLGLRFIWLFGLVGKDVSGKRGEAAGKQAKAKKKRGPGAPRFFLDILRTSGLIKQSLSLITDMLRSIHIRETVTSLKVGFADPADTGAFFSVLGPFAALIDLYTPHRITLQPAADSTIFEGYSRGKIRLRPIELVPPLVKFIFSAAALKTLKTMVAHKWKRRKQR